MKTISAVLALAFTASVNAQISSAVQQCIDDLATVQSQLNTVTTGVTNWTVASGYLGALAVQADEQTLESDINTAITDCCAVKTTVTDAEAAAVIAQVQTLVTAVQNALNIIDTRKPDFDQVPLVTNLVVTDLQNLDGLTNQLDTCLLAVTPSDYTTQANELVDEINTAFATAYSVYGISS